MSKKNKNAVTKFAVNFRPVPLGAISLNDFVSSKACDAALKVASEQENPDEKAFAFLCSYQFTEICNSVCQAGRPDLLDNEEFQKQAVGFASEIVSTHFIEMFMAVGGTISNLLAKNDAQEGGV
ncbi:hypothetical protein ACFFKC_11810 [Pseudoduganella danionis]|uniref:Uncharacterized protein n=1 Tax=Pseudoduganella danionis TaxID=1890295 RepID=A0ABW9SL20_9BURK|nr:hypothetical protein [Pseudoduganella danionis]MTW32299.1 hypothetical protein [Pseudoduganella danionis]